MYILLSVLYAGFGSCKEKDDLAGKIWKINNPQNALPCVFLLFHLFTHHIRKKISRLVENKS